MCLVLCWPFSFMVPPPSKSQADQRFWTSSLGSAATSALHPPVANGTLWKLVAPLTHLAACRKCPRSLLTACLFEFWLLVLATTLFLAGAPKSTTTRMRAEPPEPATWLKLQRKVPNTTLPTCTWSCSSATLKPLSSRNKAIFPPRIAEVQQFSG